METELLELLGQTITHEVRTGEDTWGNNSYGSPQSTSVRVDSFQQVQADPSTEAQEHGEAEVQYEASIIAESKSPQWKVGDRVTYGLHRMSITQVVVMHDETATPHHVVITARTGVER